MSLIPPSRQDYYESSLPPLDSSTAIRPFMHLAKMPPQPKSSAVSQKNGTASLCFTVDAAGIILSINLPGAIALGYPIDFLIDSALVDLIHPHDRDRWQQECQAIGVNCAQLRPSIFHFLRQDGNIIEQSMTAQVLQGASEQTVLWVGAEIQPDLATDQQDQVAAVLRLQAEWKRLMQAIALPVRQSLPLKQVLKVTATEVQRILEADRVFIYLFYPNTTGNITIEILKPGCLGIRRHPHAAAICYQKSRLLKHFDRVKATPDLEPCSPQWLNSIHQLGAKSEVVVPILVQHNSLIRHSKLGDTFNSQPGQLWGLVVVHQCQEQRHWQDWELELLNQLVTHLGIVVQQAELNQRNQRWNANLERQIRARTSQLQLAYNFEATLKRITDKVRDSLEEDQILQAALQEVARAIGVNCCNASLYDLEALTSTVHYEYTNILSPYQGRVVQMNAFPEVYSQLVHGQAFQFCSLTPNPDRGRVVMLTCPMMDDQGVLGDLWLINYPDYSFTEQDIRLVQQVANQCAIAIRQARLFQAAQAQVKELERLNHLKDDFLSTVSHELRTPMTNIKLAIQMLEVVLKQTGVLEDTTQRASKYFSILQSECRREIGLINDLLDLSRLESGSESLDLSSIDLFTWIPSVTQSFVERAHSHQQRLLLNLDPTLPTITSDRSHLERILSELLQNACKYTPAGEKIIVSAQVQDIAEQEGKLNTDKSPQKIISFSVCNTGVEILPEELSRVFEKFYRIPNNDPWQHGGTGLGLALATKLTAHLGGTLAVSSTLNKTCFKVEFPAHFVSSKDP
jgi:signal transduction histidine kinase/PAS domain-containing protein